MASGSATRTLLFPISSPPNTTSLLMAKAILVSLVLRMPCPVYRPHPIPSPQAINSAVVSKSCPSSPHSLQNDLATLPWKLCDTRTPRQESNRSPEADCLLLVFSGTNERIRISVDERAEIVLAPTCSLLIYQGTRQGHLVKRVRLLRFTPPTRGRAHNSFLSTRWLHNRPVRSRCHHETGCPVTVCSLSGISGLRLTPFDTAWRLARRKSTTFHLWVGSCIFSVNPSTSGQELKMGPFDRITRTYCYLSPTLSGPYYGYFTSSILLIMSLNQA